MLFAFNRLADSRVVPDETINNSLSRSQVLQWKLFAESERKLTFGISVLIAPPGPLATTPKIGWNWRALITPPFASNACKEGGKGNAVCVVRT